LLFVTAVMVSASGVTVSPPLSVPVLAPKSAPGVYTAWMSSAVPALSCLTAVCIAQTELVPLLF
jgi:hypothetical protein